MQLLAPSKKATNLPCYTFVIIPSFIAAKENILIRVENNNNKHIILQNENVKR